MSTRVWWVYPADDREQHATLECPPSEGGKFEAMCGRTMLAPSRRYINLWPKRRHCDGCFNQYICLPCTADTWDY